MHVCNRERARARARERERERKRKTKRECVLERVCGGESKKNGCEGESKKSGWETVTNGQVHKHFWKNALTNLNAGRHGHI